MLRLRWVDDGRTYCPLVCSISTGMSQRHGCKAKRVYSMFSYGLIQGMFGTIPIWIPNAIMTELLTEERPYKCQQTSGGVSLLQYSSMKK
eukprot:scaffold12976_cov141-Cylindrotheca_fusiformis.AAC.3